MNNTNRTNDKQLKEIDLSEVIKKRDQDQALSAKELAVLVGISYTKARTWIRTPGFPAFDGRVFWSDFTDYRRQKSNYVVPAVKAEDRHTTVVLNKTRFPEKATRILQEMECG